MTKDEKEKFSESVQDLLGSFLDNDVQMRAVVLDGKGNITDLDPSEFFRPFAPEKRPKVTETRTVVVDGMTYTLRKQGQWFLYSPKGEEYSFSKRAPKDLTASVEEFHWTHTDPGKGKSPKRSYELHELNDREHGVYHEACRLVHLVETQFPQPQVCDFYIGTAVHGVYKSESCGKPKCNNCHGRKHEKAEIFLSRHILDSLEHTLEVLVHEVAHEAGTDGTLKHLLRLQGIWAKLVMELRGANNPLWK